VKTTTGATVNGILSMEGTATVSAAPTYGAAATLQYNTATARTAGAEWITPFIATGGIIIKNTGAITTPGAVQIGNNTSVPLNINNGATLTPGANLLTLHGDFINAGTLTSGSGGVTIAGTVATQSIAGFTTTGNMSCTKTAGTATISGAVSAFNLSVNGAGGTLVLSGSNTFSGTRTLTAGTLALGNTAALGAAGTALTLAGGTLDLNTDVSVNAYNITVSAAATIQSDKATAASAGITHTLGTLSINGSTLTIAGGSNVTSGTAGITFGAVTHTGAPTYTVNDPAGGGATQLSLGAVTNSTFLTTFNGNGDVIQTGVFGAGTGGVTYSGTGTLTLNQANTFTGALTVSGGTVIGTANIAALGAGALTLSGGVLRLTHTSGTNLNFARNTTVSGNAQITSDVNVASTAGNTYTLGTLSINGSTLTIAGGSNVNSGTAGVTFGTTTLTVAAIFNVSSNNANLTLGALGGAFGITKQGTGQMTLGTTSTRTTAAGTTTLSAGTLRLNIANALNTLATAPLALNGGTLSLGVTAGATYGGTATTVGGNAVVESDLLTPGAGVTQTLGTLSIDAFTLGITAGSNVTSGTAGITFGATTFTGAPTFTVTNPAVGTTQLSVPAVNPGGFTATFYGNGNVIQTGIWGATAGGITYSGTGILTLNQANTYTGGTTLNSGTLNINNASALGTIAGTFTINGGTIDASGGAITTVNYPLALNGNFTFSGTNALNLGTGAVTMNNNSQITVSASTLTIGGIITGASYN
jgi:autotransporter-associated beta strand protein